LVERSFEFVFYENAKGNVLTATFKSFVYSKNFMLVLRIALGTLFILSGISKILNQTDFGKIIYSYNLVSKEWVIMLSFIIPYSELILGMMLILNLYPRIAIRFLIVMLIVFTGISAYSYATGNVSDCGCFGKLLKRQNDWKLILENAALAFALTGIYLLPKKEREKMVISKLLK